jgi:asparagine synthase (glutamine-hydrolysing)
MCGIAGIISINKNKVDQNALQKMADALAHRGPNGEGFYINENKNIGLAHRRLSIIDLSANGNQPLHYANRYTIIHNGEVYNYKELKTALQTLGHHFLSETDTEVIVAAYAQYGNACLQYFDGMFAFVIWDKQEQQLFIARDRFGEKPFYYYVDNETFYFASEMKALWSIGLSKEINHSLMCLYLGLGYTSIPLEPQYTFYKNIFSLPPAHFITISGMPDVLKMQMDNYWDIDKETVSNISETEAIEKFTALFSTSIKRRLRSDVAIGTSLSGGLDSSSIIAFLHSLGKNNYHSFSAVFPGFEKDESQYIELVNKDFNINGKSVEPNAADYHNDYEKLITAQEQPFVSSSVYAQYKVFELAKQHNVSVLIDGQGADETIGGYTKYIHWYLQELFLYDKKLYKEALSGFQKKASSPFGFSNKLAAWFPAPAANQLEKRAVNQLRWKSNLNQDYINANFSRLMIHKPMVKKLNDLLYHNTLQFGLEELLRYADKNAMANSIEVRLPFLQHELVEFVFSLPSHFKIKNSFQKYILRKAVDPYLNKNITWRSDKVGFETPQEQWLQNPLLLEKIKTAKEKLVALHILDKNILLSKSSNDQNWRILIAASYL